MKRDGMPAGIKPVHRRGSGLETRTPRMLVIVLKKDPTLPVNSTIRTVNQVVGGVMGVGGAQPLQHHIANIRLIIPVGILEEK